MHYKSSRTVPVVAAAASLCASLLFTGVAQAQTPSHDSNTLHKIGKSIEYPTRKGAAHISTATHRALGKNSVTNKKYGPLVRQKTVITPGGRTQPVAPPTVSGNG